MLEYWIRLWRLHPKPIRQMVLYLRKTNSPLVQVDELQVGETRHRYGVVRLWEQDPLPLLQNPALLPLATLARPVNAANNKASKRRMGPVRLTQKLRTWRWWLSEWQLPPVGRARLFPRTNQWVFHDGNLG